MIYKQKEAWKKFIEGRIAQEENREEAGLEAFEEALEIDPDNEHIRAACATAREHLFPSEASLLTQVRKSYEQLTATLPSEKPVRVDGLKAILAKLDGNHVHLRAYTRGLRS